MTSPAELARNILNAIDQHPDNFDMSDWFRRSGGNVTLRPTEEVDCGTTMCLAGWAAHLSGYTLISRTVDHADGGVETLVLASKDGVERGLTRVAMKLLGIDDDTPFHDDEDGALEWLSNIAARSN